MPAWTDFSRGKHGSTCEIHCYDLLDQAWLNKVVSSAVSFALIAESLCYLHSNSKINFDIRNFIIYICLGQL